MRRALSALAFLAIVASPTASRAEEKKSDLPPNMTVYYFGILMRGPMRSPEDTPERARISEGHMQHIRDMAKAGKLVLAGPFMDDGDWRGIVIYRTKTIEEAQKLADEDPAVVAGRFKITMHPWLIEKGVLPDPLAK